MLFFILVFIVIFYVQSYNLLFKQINKRSKISQYYVFTGIILMIFIFHAIITAQDEFTSCDYIRIDLFGPKIIYYFYSINIYVYQFCISNILLILLQQIIFHSYIIHKVCVNYQYCGSICEGGAIVIQFVVSKKGCLSNQFYSQLFKLIFSELNYFLLELIQFVIARIIVHPTFSVSYLYANQKSVFYYGKKNIVVWFFLKLIDITFKIQSGYQGEYKQFNPV
eukprot:TRINITY_DN2582_c0_g1_i8.p3 TRINITY_DN2582_c0_g1~~TRINITY_DN2582_c0_g1_i8.p3  ORF type:complete len:223 (+),score=-16.95 TRINITY_DN2582_c0_g1_i8:542-1210(+)